MSGDAQSSCEGETALGRCFDNPARYIVRQTDGNYPHNACGAHLAQRVRWFVDVRDLAAEVVAYPSTRGSSS